MISSNVEDFRSHPPAGECRPNAVLVFADLPALDLVRRRLPRALGPITRLPDPETLAALNADVHWFTTRGCAGWARLPGACIHRQAGSDFGESLELALQVLRDHGYRKIVVVGSDCPQLTADDVDVALQRLDDFALVVGPDHRGGIYLLGIHADRLDLVDGVTWRRNTDCAQLTGRVAPGTACVLDAKIDLDRVADCRLLSPFNAYLAYCLDRMAGLPPVAPDTEPPVVPSYLQVQRPGWQLPPPGSSVLN